jgi:hypothetical protein
MLDAAIWDRVNPAHLIAEAPLWALTVTVATLVLLGATTWRSYRRLSHIPGPKLAAFSQLWMFNTTSKGDLYLEAELVLRQYGLSARVPVAVYLD